MSATLQRTSGLEDKWIELCTKCQIFLASIEAQDMLDNMIIWFYTNLSHSN